MIGKFCVSIINVLNRYIQETIKMSFNYRQTPYVFVVHIHIVMLRMAFAML